MFCPFCGRQNKDTNLFCEFCKKSLPQKNSSVPETQLIANANPSTQKTSAPKVGLSYNAKRSIITGILIAGIVVVVLLIYYPSIFPWNW
jgi:uncharacterized membrane protein YvbJ